MLAHRLACVRQTPFGSLVEPDEYWMNARSSGDASYISPFAPGATSVISTDRDSRIPVMSSMPPDFEKSISRCNRSISVNSVPLSSWLRIRNSLKRCSSLMPTATGTGTMPPSIAAQYATTKFRFDLLKITSSSPGCMPRACSDPSNARERSHNSEKPTMVSSFSPSMKRISRSLPRASSSNSVSVE